MRTQKSIAGRNTAERYSVRTNTWTAAPPLPTGRSYWAAATARNGDIYAIGGFNARINNPDEAVEVYTARIPQTTRRRRPLQPFQHGHQFYPAPTASPCAYCFGLPSRGKM